MNTKQTALIVGLITIVASIVTTVVWNHFLQVPPQYTQGIMAGYQAGYNDMGQALSKSVEENKVEGIFTPTTSGKFYLQVE